MPSIPVRDTSVCFYYYLHDSFADFIHSAADWKQTVFYLGDAVAVDVSQRECEQVFSWQVADEPLVPAVQIQEDDEITGQISVKPNERNPRDLDIVIDYKATGEAAGGVAEVREYRM